MKLIIKKQILISFLLVLMLLFNACSEPNVNASSKKSPAETSDSASLDASSNASLSNSSKPSNETSKEASSKESSKPSSKPSVKPSSSKPKNSSKVSSQEYEEDYEYEDEYEDEDDFYYGYIRPDYEITPEKNLNPFTIAIYPDTQQEVVLESALKNKLFLNRSKWLVENAKALNLKFAIHTGDVVNWGNEDPKQLEVAVEAFKPLENANIPALLCIGNHDTAAVGVGGSAADPNNTWIRVRDTSAFNKAFPTSRYPRFVPFEEGKIDNGFQLISAGGLKWLVMTLELWPRDEVINWANLVISDYPDYNVIIATHSYLTDNGGIYQKSDYGSNSPQALYDRLIRQHANIKMVFSGHTGNATYRVDTGVYGNKIASFLGCFHSNTQNPVQLMKVDPKKDEVYIRTYCPSDNSYLTEYDCTVSNMGFIKP